MSDIDGQPDAVASNSTGTYNFKLPTTTYFPRRVVMEEATGTWCGWCVRGLETISRLSKEYPKNFIAIGIEINAIEASKRCCNLILPSACFSA